MDGTRKTLPAHQVPEGMPAGRKDEDTMTKPQLERLAEFRYQLRNEVLLTAAGETVLHELASRASLFGRVPGPPAGARRAKEAVQ